jgi:hypothetical protein
VERRTRQAYHAESALKAEALLTAALEAHFTENVSAASQNEDQKQA